MAEKPVEIKITAESADATRNVQAVASSLDGLGSKTTAVVKPMVDAGGAADRAGKSISGIGDAAHHMAAQMAAAFTFKELVQAAAQMEQISAGLKAVFGSAEEAGRGMEFVRGVATRVGADVEQVGRAFLGLSAATRGTAVEGEPTRQVFEAVATSMAKAGKSSAETQNALLALSQMASKGVVQMEELRGQLGEALPGALQAAANGMGITTQDLIKLAEAGQLTASDVFPALAAGLTQLYGTAPAAQTLSQEIANIKNAFVEMAANIGEAGGLDALKTGAEVAQAALVNVDITLVGLGKTLGIVMGAIATMDFSHVKEAFAEVQREAQDKLLKAAAHNSVLRSEIEATGTAAQKAALAARQHGAATQQAGSQATAASPAWVKLASDYLKNIQAMGDMADLAEKSAVAIAAEGKASEALAQALGTETEQRQAKVEATRADAQALTEVARLRLAEVEVRKAELAALQKMAAEQGKLDEQKKKQLEDLQKDIDLRKEVADKVLAQARAARIAAAAAETEAQAQKDNSSRVRELGDAYDAARKKAEELRRAQAAGKATTEQVEVADIAAGKAAALYRDALSDVASKLQARQIAEQATAKVLEATLIAEKAGYQAMIDAAQANGNYAGALYATIEQRKVEIKIIEAKVQAMRAEAEGSIAVAKAELAVLDASGKLDPVRRAQLEASIKIAEAKKKEADAVALGADAIGRQIEGLRNGTQQLEGFGKASERAGDAQGGLRTKVDATTAALEEQNAAQERLNAAVEKAAELERKRLGVDKEGFSVDKEGKRLTVEAPTRRTVYDKAKSAGMDDAEALALADRFISGNGQQTGWAGAPSWDVAVQQAIDDAVLRKAGQPVAARGDVPSASPSTSTPAPSTPTHAVSIYLDGVQRGTVATDAAGEATLQGVLRELAAARSSASAR